MKNTRSNQFRFNTPAQHPITSKKLDVEFKIEQYPETNPDSYYCYYITAQLKGDLSFISDIEIIFILPEFINANGSEPYRVDSFHYHRKPLPNSNSRGKNNRLLSAKFIDGQWKGAIFIYHDNFLVKPEKHCFKAIKNDLKINILNALSNLHKLLNEGDLVDDSAGDIR